MAATVALISSLIDGSESHVSNLLCFDAGSRAPGSGLSTQFSALPMRTPVCLRIVLPGAHDTLLLLDLGKRGGRAAFSLPQQLSFSLVGQHG